MISALNDKYHWDSGSRQVQMKSVHGPAWLLRRALKWHSTAEWAGMHINQNEMLSVDSVDSPSLALWTSNSIDASRILAGCFWQPSRFKVCSNFNLSKRQLSSMRLVTGSLSNLQSWPESREMKLHALPISRAPMHSTLSRYLIQVCKLLPICAVL